MQEDLRDVSPDAAHQPLPILVASHISLNSEQWGIIPKACPGLGPALPTALASSLDQARQLVCRLPRGFRAPAHP